MDRRCIGRTRELQSTQASGRRNQDGGRDLRGRRGDAIDSLNLVAYTHEAGLEGSAVGIQAARLSAKTRENETDRKMEEGRIETDTETDTHQR